MAKVQWTVAELGEILEILVLEYDFACTRTCTWEVNSWDLKCSIFYKKFVWFCILQGGIDTATKSTDSFFKRKCLFPYLNNTKKILSDNKSKVLLELNGFLCEENGEEDLLFTKKHLHPCLYQLALKYLSVPATTASIERIFSQSGLIMRPRRASLIGENVCLLSF